ncbi:MAG: FAD/NAD(P)-binding oxidoreductase [Candidatus Omnitrophica bacterium]|nr:FAD/NAD(P)-binding oxidoreductase [Candidatus Omnitrophota bacterium]
MNVITVIGAGRAGRQLVEKIKKIDPAVPITIIDKNTVWVDNESLFKMSTPAVRLELSDWAEKNNVTFINAFLDRISARRKKLYFKDRDVMDFEKVILATGIKSKKLDIKGMHREMVCYLTDIEMSDFKNTMRVAVEITVIAETLVGLFFAVALKEKGKDVTVVMSDSSFLGAEHDELISLLNGHGITVYDNAKISEIIGERYARAVKIEPLKVFSTDIIFVDSGFCANNEFFDDPIMLKDKFFTQYPAVLAVGNTVNDELMDNSKITYDGVDINGQADVLSAYLVTGEKLLLDRIGQNVDNRTLYINGIKEKLDNIKNSGIELPKVDSLQDNN